jgi:hypothetical protein
VKKNFDLSTLRAKSSSAFHEEWRKGWQSRPGNTVESPRWRPTSDQAWISKNQGSVFCNEGGEVNINIDFELLPSDWKKDNVEAAELAIPIAISAYENGTIDAEDYELVTGDLIHKAWLDRRREKEGHTEEFQKLDIPFVELEQWRQEQDQVQARIARRLVLEAAAS